jgi:DNA repair ATPase RecN
MKKAIFLSILFCPFISGAIKGQGAMVVTDPGNLAQIMELVKTGADQTEKINKQVEFLQQAKENLEKVNSFLKTARTVDKAISQSQETIKSLNRISNQLNKLTNLSPAYLGEVTKVMKDYYTALNESVVEITSCLSDGKYKMSDADRLKYINEQLGQIQYINTKMNKTYEDAQRINNRRRIIGG